MGWARSLTCTMLVLMPNPSTIQLTDQTISTIAAEADTDPRSVLRRLAGLPVKGRAGARVARVIAARGISPLGGSTPSSPAPASR